MRMNEIIEATMTRDEYIALARDNSTWQEIAASWALEGISISDDNDEIAGRMIAGELTLDEATVEIRRKAGIPFDPSVAPINESVQ